MTTKPEWIPGDNPLPRPVIGPAPEPKQPVRAPGEVSTERVQRALAMAAGDILQRSKLPPEERMRIAAEVSKLAADYEALAGQAWEG